MNKTVAGLFCTSLLAGCSFTAEFFRVNDPLEGVVPFYTATSAKTMAACSNDPSVGLYRLQSDGQVSPTPLAEAPLDSSGRFTFGSPSKFGVEKKSATTQFVLQVNVCGEEYFRPVTGFKNQDITVASSFLAMFTTEATPQAQKLNFLAPSVVESLISTISTVEGPSLQETYDNLLGDSEKSHSIEAVLQTPLTHLMDLKPTLVSESVPLTVDENTTGWFSVTGGFWHSSYPMVYEWLIDGVEVSRNSQFPQSFIKNSKATYEVTANIGQDRGDGAINRDKPFLTRTYTIHVVDVHPAIVPPVTLVSGTPANSLDVSLQMATGASFVNCETFSSFAITQDQALPPLASEFTHSCTTEGAQVVHFMLSPGDGLRTLRIWTKDFAGRISTQPAIKNIVIDTTAPTVNLGSLAKTLYRAGETLSLSFSAADASSGLDSVKLQYSGDGLVFSDVAAVLGQTSYNYVVPAGSTTQAQIRMIATDSVGLSTAVTTNTFTVDGVAPTAPVLTLTSPSPTNQNTAFLNITCSADTDKILFSESANTPSLNEQEWESCAPTKNFVMSVGDGTKAIYAWSRDAAGNISAVSTAPTVVLDRASPALSLLSLTSGDYAGGSTQVISWAASDLTFGASPILLEYSLDGGTSWQNIGSYANGTHSCTLSGGASGCVSWTLPSVDSTQVRIRATASDLAGNSPTVISGDMMTVVSTLPQVTAMSITEGVSTINKNIRINFAAAGVSSLITHFCLKFTPGAADPVKPGATDGCWIAVNSPAPGVAPALDINFSGFYFSLGLTAGNYRVYGWVKNKAGLISDTNTYAAIEYLVQPAPVLTNIIAVNTDSHQTPPTAAELTSPQDSSVYVKWKVATGLSIPSDGIKIYYTLDEVNYTLLAQNISDAAHGGCTVDGTTYTGCAVVAAPSSGFFKIRIAVTDSIGQVTLGSASPNNLNSFRILAGNTESGIGGSASSAIFNFGTSAISGQPGAIVVADDGTFYVRSGSVGILRILPTTGIAEIFIPYTGVMNNGPIGTATLRRTQAFMSIDYQNNLLIYDYDVIRKVNLSTGTVSTLIGGGTTKISGNLASEFKMDFCSAADRCPLVPLPNGDIYFSDNQSEKKIWKYTAATQRVTSITLSGTGLTGRPATDDVSSSSYIFLSFQLEYDVTTSVVKTVIAQFKPDPCAGCGVTSYSAFINPATGQTISSPTPGYSGNSNFKPAVTARNGKIYGVVVESSKTLIEYNSTTNTWAPIFGSGSQGVCADGTLALSCDSMIMDAFVTADGRIFFTDNGLVRTLDSDGKVKTLFGQLSNFGDGGLAMSARIHSARYFDFLSNGDIVFLDGLENEVRRFTVGGTIRHVAGNGRNAYAASGSVAATASIAGNWWGGHAQLIVDPVTDDIYIGQSSIMKIPNEATPVLTRVVGAGSTSYALGDNLPGTSVTITTSERAELVGIRDRKLLVIASSRNASNSNYRCYAKEYDIADSYRQSHVAGNDNSCSDTTPAVGVATTSADVGNVSNNRHLVAQWDGDVSGWIIPKADSTLLRTYVLGGAIQSAIPANLAEPVLSLTMVKNASNQKVLYYCGSTTQKIYKYNLSTGVQAALPWPTNYYDCNQGALRYNATRGSVVFSYTHDGLVSFAEILDTP